MLPPGAFTAFFVPFCDITLAGLMLWVLARAARRANLTPVARFRLIGASALALAVWYGTVSTLAARNVFLATPDTRFPALPIAVFLPVIAALTLLPRMRGVGRILDVLPLPWLIRLQVTRIMGAVFLIAWAQGSLPEVFALPAGLGDIATGITAFFVARRASALTIIPWTVLGLLDFAVALGTGFLSSPGRFQLLALGQPNLFASAWPLVLVPAFGMPIFMVLHAMTLWKLKRQRLGAAAGGWPAGLEVKP